MDCVIIFRKKFLVTGGDEAVVSVQVISVAVFS